MTKDSLFYKILSCIHIVFFVSILSVSTILLSGTILMIPVLGAAFLIGKDYIYKELNITDSVVKIYFNYLKKSMFLVKFVPINFVILLNLVGMFVAAKENNFVYSVICLVIISLLITFTLYIAGYYVFISKNFNMVDAALCMMLKLQFLIPIFAIIVVCSAFFSIALLVILFFTGAFFLFAFEVVVFIHTLYYKRMLGNLDKEDEFAYLVYKDMTKK